MANSDNNLNNHAPKAERKFVKDGGYIAPRPPVAPPPPPPQQKQK